jgi:hypothetical protein
MACRGHVKSMSSAGVEGMYIACKGHVEGVWRACSEHVEGMSRADQVQV